MNAYVRRVENSPRLQDEKDALAGAKGSSTQHPRDKEVLKC
jgi:hypothetical protein